MAENIQDPWATNGTDETGEDEFATAKTEWLDLTALDGRLIVIDVLSLDTKKGQDGEDYPYAECNVIVLDGEPIPGLLDTVPGVSEGMHISATGVFGQIKGFAGKGKPFLARLDSVPSKRNKQIKVMGVRKHEVTETDKALALPVWRQYRSGQFA